MIWLCSFRAAFAFALPAGNDVNSPAPTGNATHPGLICSPFGICEPCPEDAVSPRQHVCYLINVQLYSLTNHSANLSVIGA
jgi:hypothetical protein